MQRDLRPLCHWPYPNPDLEAVRGRDYDSLDLQGFEEREIEGDIWIYDGGCGMMDLLATEAMTEAERRNG
ncbi:unnamed protein product [Linum trigynum]|uniref:Uncharacterized protein n=1 Tax=Linum trigynum TaxID=586398 RepID=A0AAV2EEX8_9ROSI